jgi:AcrR family transcriptional regulator
VSADPVAAEREHLDPRVERSRRAVVEAAIDELGEVGYGAMTIESVARRAGVGKATVYRHWNGKLDLVASVLEVLRQEVMVIPDGTPRERVVATVHGLVEYLGHSRLSQCLPALVSAAQYDESVRDFHYRYTAARRRQLVEHIEEAQLAGEVRRDTDPRLVAEALVGPIFYRRLMTPDPFTRHEVADFVDLVLPRP